jgi:hypothetical protein
MGLVGYCKRFIAGFSNIFHLVTSLQKKGLKFEWTTKCEGNFNLLKELLTNAPILNIVYPNENFVVCTCMQRRTWWNPHLICTCH